MYLDSVLWFLGFGFWSFGGEDISTMLFNDIKNRKFWSEIMDEGSWNGMGKLEQIMCNVFSKDFGFLQALPPPTLSKMCTIFRSLLASDPFSSTKINLIPPSLVSVPDPFWHIFRS